MRTISPKKIISFIMTAAMIFALLPSITVRAAVPPTINTDFLTNAIKDTSYIYTLAAIGDAPITWSIESGSLPGGLSLNTSTGEISGTPTDSGKFDFIVKATNGGGSATQSLSITVNERTLEYIFHPDVYA